MPPQSSEGITTPSGRKFSFTSEKVLGYLLLAGGLLIIAVATFSALRVLGGKTKAPGVFEFEAPTIKLPQVGSNLSLPEGVELPQGFSLSQDQTTPSEMKVLSDEAFNALLDLGIFYMAMMFLASTGLKVCEIGIKLVKDIKVTIKEEKIKPSV